MESKISKSTFVFMLIVAGFFDLVGLLINLIPVLGGVLLDIGTVMAGFIFFIWFKLKGANFVKPTRALGFGGGLLAELIPVVNAAPAWILSVIIIVMSTWAEDKIQATTGVNMKAATAITQPALKK